MKTVVLVFSLLASSFVFALAFAGAPCAKETPQDSFIYRNHVNDWQQSPETMALAYQTAYAAPQRLKYRFFSRNDQILAPLPGARGIVSLVKVEESFVAMITRHILDALSKQYASYVFFPDMGHGHFRLQKGAQSFMGSEAEVATQLMASSDLKILYHTAEQLMSPDLRKLSGDTSSKENKLYLWRLLNRHLIGSANPQQKIEVFLDDGDVSAAGYEGASGVVYLSANRGGCFSYSRNGQETRFDMSLVPYGADPDAPPVEEND